MSAPASSGVLSRVGGRLERWAASPLFWGALLVIGLAVRCRQYLFAHSYWWDEAFLLLPIRERGFADLLGPQPYNLVIPPLFLWLMRALYEIGGDGELLMRLPAFLAGVAALFLMVPLARKIVGDAHAVWAVAFLAVCRHALSHGCEVRPYTFDVLIVECVLYCSAILLDPSAAPRTRRWAAAGLGASAALGPWLSFPSAFALGGASLALAIHLGQRASRREWLAWVAFNGITGASVVLLWWFSGRHMYYTGMTEHWGHQGWGGFPDWGSPLAIGKWLLGRPVDVGNYGNRDLGVVLTLLAVVGAFALAKRSRALVVLLTAPFALAVMAALVGKYPLANRTGFFLLPCLWLLAARGIGGLVAWGRRRRLELACVGFLLIAWDLTWVVVKLARPDGYPDFRGAYQFVHAHREPADQLWSQTAVVYQTYYGKDAPVLMDHELEEAVQRVKRQRMWVVVGDNRHDLRRHFEAGGGRIAVRHHVSGLEVLLFEPGDEAAGGWGDVPTPFRDLRSRGTP